MHKMCTLHTEVEHAIMQNHSELLMRQPWNETAPKSDPALLSG